MQRPRHRQRHRPRTHPTSDPTSDVSYYLPSDSTTPRSRSSRRQTSLVPQERRRSRWSRCPTRRSGDPAIGIRWPRGLSGQHGHPLVSAHFARLLEFIKAQAAARVWVGVRLLRFPGAKGLGDLPGCNEKGASERRPAMHMLSCPDFPRL
jgi:hypothetical protein